MKLKSEIKIQKFKITIHYSEIPYLYKGSLII
jgi:hypothetical protein